MNVVRAAVCCVVLAFTARPAFADWLFTPFVGYTFRGSTTIVDPETAAGVVHFNFGGAATLIGAGLVGAEALFVYTPGFFDRDDPPEEIIIRSRSIALMGNVVVAMPRRWNQYGLRPFFSGGVGLLHAGKTDLLGVFPGLNFVGYNLGGGAVGFFSERTGVRFDLRRFGSVRSDEESALQGFSFGPARLSYWTAEVGVVFRLGAGGPSGRPPR
jgi:hypothetical protein